jgi:GxxExxY protein
MDSGSARTVARSGKDLVEGRLTGEVIGAFFEVYNTLRFGFLESVYARAMQLELTRRSIPHVREAVLVVRFKGDSVGRYRPDLLVAGRLVVELKATYASGDADRRQLLNYLRATGMQVGLLLHFGPEPAFHRVVLSRGSRISAAPD